MFIHPRKARIMQVTAHVYRPHIAEDPNDGGVMHPGGSNIYFVGDPSDRMVLIDTGEHYREWTRRILDFYVDLGNPSISAILITHGHNDHIGGLDRLQDRMKCQVQCHPRLYTKLARVLDTQTVKELRSREAIPVGGGSSLRALFTPGHADDHVCYYMPGERVMFSGDTILGGSSTTVSDLYNYMKSLELLARYRPRIICPGHGPIVTEALPRIESYIAHRQRREQQVMAALEQGLTSVEQIVRYVYPPNLRMGLKEAAARNVLTHLAKLQKEGRVEEASASYILKVRLMSPTVMASWSNHETFLDKLGMNLPHLYRAKS